MTTPNNTPRTKAFANEMYSSGIDAHCDGQKALDFARQLETELNEAKAQLAPRNGHTFESLTKMWEDGHFFYAKIQSQLLTTQAECAALRTDLDKQVSVTLGQMQTITELRAQVEEMKKCRDTMPGDYIAQLRTRQEELMANNEKFRSALKNARCHLLSRNGLDRDADNDAAVAINRVLTAFQEGMK